MLFTRSAIEALPHLELAADALRATHPELQIGAVLSGKGWVILLQGRGSLTLARSCFASAARADAFLARIAAACGRTDHRHVGRKRPAGATHSGGAIAVVDGAYFYFAGPAPNSAR